jgi:hypothetical protein
MCRESRPGKHPAERILSIVFAAARSYPAQVTPEKIAWMREFARNDAFHAMQSAWL